VTTKTEETETTNSSEIKRKERLARVKKQTNNSAWRKKIDVRKRKWWKIGRR